MSEKLREEMQELRRDFAKRAVAEIQERVKDKASVLVQIAELDERIKEREQKIFQQLKILGDRQRLVERHIFDKFGMLLEEDEGHRI